MDNQNNNSQKKIFIANWKSNKTSQEVQNFIEELKNHKEEINFENKTIVIAPSFTLLPKTRQLVDEANLQVKLSGQNVSPFPEGAYTGDVNAKQVKEFAEYVIIGHSERKRYFHESENDVENKIKEAEDQGLIVVQCIQNENSQIHDKADVVAYEPPDAISTFGVGEAEDPEEIRKVFEKISEELKGRSLLYGGSVNKDNIESYLKIDICAGFLIGGASLDPQSFMSLINKW